MSDEFIKRDKGCYPTQIEVALSLFVKKLQSNRIEVK